MFHPIDTRREFLQGGCRLAIFLSPGFGMLLILPNRGRLYSVILFRQIMLFDEGFDLVWIC